MMKCSVGVRLGAGLGVSARISVALGLCCLLGLISGCASSPTVSNSIPRFHEARDANVVLRFSSWDYTFLSKPFYAENGFMQQVGRENLDQVLSRFQINRRMAVVVIGWQYNGTQLDEIVSEWKNILGRCGFERVVVLRASQTSELNGSVIVEDTRIPIGTAQAS